MRFQIFGSTIIESFHELLCPSRVIFTNIHVLANILCVKKFKKEKEKLIEDMSLTFRYILHQISYCSAKVS